VHQWFSSGSERIAKPGQQAQGPNVALDLRYDAQAIVEQLEAGRTPDR
jgi:hypothetical protein